MHTANNSYSIKTPKPNNITAHLPQTLTYLKHALRIPGIVCMKYSGV